MLVKPSIDELLPKTQNRYTLAVLVAKRTRQLVSGAQPLIDSNQPNLVTLASEEVEASAVVGVPGEVKPEVPLRPEVLAAQEAARQQDENQQALDAIRTTFGLTDEELANRPQPTFLTLLDDQLTREAEEAERAAAEEAARKAQAKAAEEAEDDDEDEEPDDVDVVLEEDDEDETIDDDDVEQLASLDEVSDDDDEEEV